MDGFTSLFEPGFRDWQVYLYVAYSVWMNSSIASLLLLALAVRFVLHALPVFGSIVDSSERKAPYKSLHGAGRFLEKLRLVVAESSLRFPESFLE